MDELMLSKNFVRLIERNADRLAKRVLNDLKVHPGTKKYRTYDDTEVYNRAFQVYSHFGEWILNGYSKEEIKNAYTALGRERRREGFALSEVIQALIIIRRHIWLLVDSEGLSDSAFDLRRVIELVNRSVLFFDRAIYFTAVGFETAG